MSDLPRVLPNLRVCVLWEEPDAPPGEDLICPNDRYELLRAVPDAEFYLRLLGLPREPLSPWFLEDEGGDPRQQDEQGDPLYRYRAHAFATIPYASEARNRAICAYLHVVPAQTWVVLDWW
jgi:hypothetical protein